MQSARWDRHFEKPLRFHWRLSQGGEKPNASRALNQSSPETGLPDSNPSLSLTDLFPHRVCINLDRRPERWKQTTGFQPCSTAFSRSSSLRLQH
jgi:hypothetical protein